MSRVLVPCHVKGTVALQMGDVRTSQGRPGVLVIDVTFPGIAPFEVSKPCGRNPGSWAGLTWEPGRDSGTEYFTQSRGPGLALEYQLTIYLFL